MQKEWHTATKPLYYLKGLLALFCLSSKRYHVPFCRLQKGISYCTQIQKICEK
jgi:hypothetical protein